MIVTKTGLDGLGNPIELQFWQNADNSLTPISHSHTLGSITLGAPLLSGSTSPGAGTARPVNGDNVRLEVVCPGAFAVRVEGRRSGGSWFTLPVMDGAYSIEPVIETEGLYRVHTSVVDEIRAVRVSGTAALTVR